MTRNEIIDQTVAHALRAAGQSDMVEHWGICAEELCVVCHPRYREEHIRKYGYLYTPQSPAGMATSQPGRNADPTSLSRATQEIFDTIRSIVSAGTAKQYN